jgi:hypothetical protein
MLTMAISSIASATVHKAWPNSLYTIQTAINACANGDTVEVQNGTYYGLGNWDLDFNGKAILVHSKNDDPTTVILDLNGGFGGRHRAFFFHHGETNSSILRGITMRDGHNYDPGT